jgi:hypothetical protein
MRHTLSRYLMTLLCMLAAGAWILPVHTLAAPVPMPLAQDGDEGALDLDPTSAIAVESVAGVVLLPREMAPSEPAPGIEVILLLDSQAVPEECLALLGLATPEGAGSANAPVEVRVELHSVAVAFVRKGESTIRFGFGLRSDVVVTVQSQASGTLAQAESFQLVSETASAGEAVDGSLQLWSQVSQAAPAPAPPFPYYSTCVTLCLTEVHNQWWGVVMDCIAYSGIGAALVSGAAVLACLLTGPGWLACVTALLTGIGIVTGMVWASCLASYLAAMALAIPVCTAGCAL